MKHMHKLLLFLLLFPVTLMATDNNGKHTKTKKINKEYNVDADATLQVSNKYGNIDISAWNNSKITIEVVITTNGNDLEKVEKRLDQIDVDFDANSSHVSAKTMIEKKF